MTLTSESHPRRELGVLRSAVLGLLLRTPIALAVGCGGPVESTGQNRTSPRITELDVTVRVTGSRLVTVPRFAYGMHTSVYDNALYDPRLPDQLAAAGIAMLRYPGGGYSDNYHWSTHSMTAWADGNDGYLADRSDFGSYVSVLESTGTAAMITVNYGSNQRGNGPGEPKEAAAWVAYANGSPDDGTVIGLDSVGNDWKTVGYWAGVRGDTPLPPIDPDPERIDPIPDAKSEAGADAESEVGAQRCQQLAALCDERDAGPDADFVQNCRNVGRAQNSAACNESYDPCFERCGGARRCVQIADLCDGADEEELRDCREVGLAGDSAACNDRYDQCFECRGAQRCVQIAELCGGFETEPDTGPAHACYEVGRVGVRRDCTESYAECRGSCGAHLRIAHPEPLGIQYWEVGNEVFGNGYYGSLYELDLHLPSNVNERQGNPRLSPTTYGKGVLDYVREMKAVDPGIKVGAVLNTPPGDYSWGPDWNENVLTECGRDIDFAIVHWYPSGSMQALLQAPGSEIPRIRSGLAGSLKKHGGADWKRIELVINELGFNSSVQLTPEQGQVRGIFAADAYLTFIEHGFVNVAWLELHNGSFLSERGPFLGSAYHGIQMAHLLAAPGDTLLDVTLSEEGVVRAHAARRSDGSTALMLINLHDTITAYVSIGSEAGRPDRVQLFAPEGESATGRVAPEDDPPKGSVLKLPPFTVMNLYSHVD